MRSDAALIRSNQCLSVRLKSFTQYARKDLICDREKAYTSIVGAYCGVSLFQDRTQSTKVSIAGHDFFQPYSADKLLHAPKQLSREAMGPWSLVVFESLYCNSDLVMAGRRYLYRFAVFSRAEINVTVASP